MIGWLTDEAPKKCCMKSTQSGFSETLIIDAIGDAETGRSVFYVLPTDILKNRFVDNRWEKSVSYTRYYRELMKYSAQKFDNKAVDNKSLKDIGDGVVAFVGSNTPSVFTEFPADTLIIDEKDRCHQEYILMGVERLSHSSFGAKEISVSQPTIEGFGIHEDFNMSDQKWWVIQCPHCNNWFIPDFFSHVLRQDNIDDYVILDKEWSWEKIATGDIRMVCDKCNKPISKNEAYGEWIAKYPSRYWICSGYQASKLFSSLDSISKLVLKLQGCIGNPSKMARLYNADLGLPYNAEGSKITRSLLDRTKAEYTLDIFNGNAKELNQDSICFMGVDVGAKLNVVIRQYVSLTNKLRLIYAGEVDNYEDIERLYNRFYIKFGIIDAMPENRLSKKIVASLSNMFMCYYENNKKDGIDGYNKIISVERTAHLDAVLEYFTLQTNEIPRNAHEIPSYYEQLMASTRIYYEDKEKYSWEHTEPDHYFHAEGYCLLARRMFILITGR